jgi:hypothetical protein
MHGKMFEPIHKGHYLHLLLMVHSLKDDSESLQSCLRITSVVYKRSYLVYFAIAA